MEHQQAAPFGPPSFGQAKDIGGMPILPRDSIIMAGQEIAADIAGRLPVGEPDRFAPPAGWLPAWRRSP